MLHAGVLVDLHLEIALVCLVGLRGGLLILRGEGPFLRIILGLLVLGTRGLAVLGFLLLGILILVLLAVVLLFAVLRAISRAWGWHGGWCVEVVM